jgi:predicted DNA-binding transcriptional regulator AlpA
MTPAPHIVSAIKALMAGYPDSHKERVVDAFCKGPKVKLMELARNCNVSRRTAWRWIKSGKLPKPMHRGKRVCFWEYNQVAHIMKDGGLND